MKRIILSLLFLVILPVKSPALQPEPDSVFVRVIDCGQALSCVVAMPDNHYMVYDVGAASAMQQIREIIPHGSVIDLLVISHNDADHLRGVDDLCSEYQIARVLRTGHVMDTDTYRLAEGALNEQIQDGTCLDFNYGRDDIDILPGSTWNFGGAYVTVVFGLDNAPDDWISSYHLTEAEQNNIVSICVRLQYNGHSVLFTGDTVGRHSDDDETACIGAERAMAVMNGIINIDSDVLIGQHHGADNACSVDFINAVSPEYVIFSAGHNSRYRHPRQVTAERLINNCNIVESHIFRTDWGDDEGADEWNYGRINGNTDMSGDDDIDILIRSDGELFVDWENPEAHQ